MLLEIEACFFSLSLNFEGIESEAGSLKNLWALFFVQLVLM